MATIQESGRLVEKIYLINLANTSEKSITVLLSGQHGIGKTEITRQAARNLGGVPFTIEGGSLKEGEFVGIPFLSKDENDEIHMEFIKYPAIQSIRDLQKHYYGLAKGKGFLDGRLKLNDRGEVEYRKDSKSEPIIYGKKNDVERVVSGDDNKYSFGEDFPFELKLELIKSGEIKPVLILLDEMNRTDEQTMKEFMNILLNRKVQNYDLPWWAQFVAAQNPSSNNSSYAVQELDPAQSDRFLKINTLPSLDEFTSFMSVAGYDNAYIDAIEQVGQLTDEGDSSLKDTQDMTPSPRSWETVATIHSVHEKLLKDGNFNHFNISQDDHRGDLRTLINGKVGTRAGTAFLTSLDNVENTVRPSEILTGKSLVDEKGILSENNADHISKSVRARLNKQPSLRKRNTSLAILRHISENWLDWSSSTTKEGKERFEIIKVQIQGYIKILSDDKSAIKNFITQMITNVNAFGVDTPTGRKSLFVLIHKLVSKDLVKSTTEGEKQLREIQNMV